MEQGIGEGDNPVCASGRAVRSVFDESICLGLQIKWVVNSI